MVHFRLKISFIDKDFLAAEVLTLLVVFTSQDFKAIFTYFEYAIIDATSTSPRNFQ